MTDEEKAEEYYEDNECYSYLSEVEDFEEVFSFVKDRVKQAYLDGLAEGREEKCNSCGLRQQKRINLGKENEQLRAQIEKMKCCRNCKHYGNYKDDFMCTLVGQKIHCKNKDKWELAE